MDERERIREVLYEYLKSGLIDADVTRVLECVSDDIIGIGMGEQGLVYSKQTMQEIMTSGIKADTDADTNAKYELDYEQVEIVIHNEVMANVCARVIVKRSHHGVVSKSGLMQSLTLKRQDGRWLICSFHASPVMLSEESIDAYPLNFAENTLAHLKAEIQTEALDLMNESIAGGIISCYFENDKFSLCFINDSMLEYLGFTREEFTGIYGDSVIESIHPEDQAMVKKSIETALLHSSDYGIRHRIIKRDGDYLWMAARGRGVVDRSGKIVVLVVFVDITEMVQLQNELKEQTSALALSEERFRIALEKTSNLIFDYDIISGNIMHSSAPKKSMDLLTNIKNIKKSLIIGGEVEDDFLDDLDKTFLRIQNGENQTECIIQVKLATGKKIWNKISMTGVPNDEGRTVRAIGMIENITKQKEAEIAYAREEQYRQAILSDSLASYVINFTKDQFENSTINSDYCVMPENKDGYDNAIHATAAERLSETDKQTFLDMFLSANVIRQFKTGKTEFKLEYLLFNQDGTDVWMQTNLRLVLDAATNEIKGFMYVTDINS